MRLSAAPTAFLILFLARAASANEFLDLNYYEGPGADTELQALDLYLPEDVEAPPLLMWIHGGAWAFGGRRSEARLAKHFVAAGIAVASIDHRLSAATWADPGNTEGALHPAHVEDCARAFKWLSERAELYGYDAGRLYVGGYSSGAHLSALLSMDPKYLAAEGLGLDAIRGSLPVAGAYDLNAYYDDHLRENGRAMADSHVLGVFGSAESLSEASPSEYLETATVPMLVVSESDTHEYTLLFAERVRDEGALGISFLHEATLDHRGLAQSISGEAYSMVRSEMIEFITGSR